MVGFRMLTKVCGSVSVPAAKFARASRDRSGVADASSPTDSPLAVAPDRFLTRPLIVTAWPSCTYDGLTDVTVTASGAVTDLPVAAVAAVAACAATARVARVA